MTTKSIVRDHTVEMMYYSNVSFSKLDASIPIIKMMRMGQQEYPFIRSNVVIKN